MALLLPGLILYGLLALAAYLPVWPGNPRRVPWCACGDTAQTIWFLRWSPFALMHGHSLYASNRIDFPSGSDLAQNVSMPLLGAVSAPLTWLAGPVSAFTFLLWLAIASSASSCFVVLLRWVRWMPAAFAGGLVYAFGPYMAAQALGHLNVVFPPIPPVLILVLDELIVDQRGSARRWGISLGLLAGAQFLISPEVLIDCILMAGHGAADTDGRLLRIPLGRPHGHAGRRLGTRRPLRRPHGSPGSFGVNPSAAVGLFRGAFGPPTVTEGVDVWHLGT